jgi:uncharacterized SAM-binding protein YcdF (DUF218 family)
MFFILSKILAFIISPITWIIALLFISVFSKNTRRKKKSLVSALVLLLFFSNSFLFDVCMKLWEVPAIAENQLKTTYDAGIVLGGIMSYDPAIDRVQFNRRNDRLMQAVVLYKKGIIKKIFFTSGSATILRTDAIEAHPVRDFLHEIGINPNDIVIEDASRNTRENALFSKPILEKNFPGGKFLLITSAFHMRRGIGCFKKVGIETTPFSTDRYNGPRKYVFDYLFIPTSDTLFNWDTLVHEMVGYLTYKIFGYA